MLTDGVITFDRFIRFVLGILLFVGLLMLLNRLSGVLLPFFTAWLLAYMIYPLVSFYQYKLRIKYRILAIVASFLTIVGVGVLMSYFIFPPIIEEFDKVRVLLMEYIGGNINNANIPETIGDFIKNNFKEKWMRTLIENGDVMAAVKAGLPKLWSILTESFNLVFSLVTFFIMLLYIVFILLDYETLSRDWIHLLPKKYRTGTTMVFEDIKDGMNRYFRGQAFVALCVGILFSIGFLIIDFPLAIGLGMFIGLLNMVPYLQVIGLVPMILLAILKAADTGENFWVILALGISVFCIVQVIQDSFIVPRVMGKITGLNPAIILLSLSIWGSLMGMLGMIIALPLTTLLLSYYQRFVIDKGSFDEI